MPRGFLVKRTKKQQQGLAQNGQPGSEDERSSGDAGSGSDFDAPLQLTTSHMYHYPYGSPDSGFSQSPVNLCTSSKDSRSSNSQPRSPTNSWSSTDDISSNKRAPSPVPTTEVARDEGMCYKYTKVDTDNLTSKPFSHQNLSDKPAEIKKVPHPFGVPPHLVSSALSATSAAYGSPFYFSAFDRLNVTSPKGLDFSRSGPHPPFLPPPGLFPGYPTMTLPSRAPPQPLQSSQSSPGSLVSPNKRKADTSSVVGSPPKPKSAKKPKAARKIHFDEDKSSPVSGTIIRDPSDVDDDNGIRVVSGDIDSSLNFVEVTPEAREEIAKIDNKIGAYVCQLCKEHYEDAFQLAQHRCSRIVHVEYRCPECDKVFNCPANLASHRRWHKPRPNNNNNNNSTNNNNNNSSNGNKNSKASGNLLKAEAKRALDAINGNITNGHLHPAMFVDNKMARTNFMINRGIENMIQHQQQQQQLPSHTQGLSRATPSPDGGQQEAEGHFDCDVCGKKFRRQAYLKKHMATHVESERSLPCPMCSKVFRNESTYAQHMVQAHNSMQPPSYQPPVTPAPTDLSPRGGEHACALCGVNLTSKLDLEHHQRMQHPNDVYSCKYCTAVFYSSPGLTRHINKCHPSENRQVILLHMPPMAPQINSPC